VLGAARIAENGTVTPTRLTGARLVASGARNRRRAQAFAVTHGVERVLDSYADVVIDPEVEQSTTRCERVASPWNLAAITDRKHVLSERPFAADAEEAAEVRDAGQRAGVTVGRGVS
jgi:predicted dehydrogenase